VLERATRARHVDIGVAAFDALDVGHMERIARADRAMYAAKESGRNRRRATRRSG